MNSPNNQSDFLRNIDVVCFSHLRWGFVYQRPQHLLSRFAKHTRVFYMEEPIFYHGINTLELTKHGDSGLYVAVPYLQHGLPQHEVNAELAKMVDGLLQSENIKNYCAWYYTPMALLFTENLTPDITVEYILTADGKLRIVGFNRTSVDVTLGQRNRTGVRLSYQKEFDKKRNDPKRKEPLPDIKVKPN